MGYKIKIFSGKDTESEANKWLSEHDVEVVQVIPCLAVSSIPVNQPVNQPLRGIIAQTQVQVMQVFNITIVYKE